MIAGDALTHEGERLACELGLEKQGASMGLAVFASRVASCQLTESALVVEMCCLIAVVTGENKASSPRRSKANRDSKQTDEPASISAAEIG